MKIKKQGEEIVMRIFRIQKANKTTEASLIVCLGRREREEAAEKERGRVWTSNICVE